MACVPTIHTTPSQLSLPRGRTEGPHRKTMARDPRFTLDEKKFFQEVVAVGMTSFR